MNIKYLLERIFTGKNVKFLEGSLIGGKNDGNKVLIVLDTETNKKFVLNESLENFMRFRKWVGKQAYADYEPMIKKVNTNFGFLKAIRITTEVEISSEKDNENKGDIDL